MIGIGQRSVGSAVLVVGMLVGGTTACGSVKPGGVTAAQSAAPSASTADGAPMTPPASFDQLGDRIDAAPERAGLRQAIETDPIDLTGDGTYTLTAVTAEPDKWTGIGPFALTAPVRSANVTMIGLPAVTTQPSGRSIVSATVRIAGLSGPFSGFRLWLY